ncbi:MAG: methyl-accepting chemotaxis protein [Pseudomonadota bacterium]
MSVDSGLPEAIAKTRGGFWTLSRKIAAGAGLAIALSVAIVVGWTMAVTQSQSNIAFLSKADAVTTLTAQPLGGAIRFGKSDVLAPQFADFSAANGSETTFIGAFKSDGSLVAAEPAEAADPRFATLAAEAIETEAAAISPDGLLRAEPVRFGKKDEVVGALVIAWSDAALRADIEEKMLTLVGIGLGTALAFSLAGAALATKLVAKPLRSLGEAVARLAAGENVEIAAARRRDEIGDLGRAMRVVYEQGLVGMRTRSALDQASALVMIVDSEGAITYANAPLRAALNGDLVGEPIGAYAGASSLESVATATTAGELDLRYEERLYKVAANPILSADGAHQGSVIEWRDVTAETRAVAEISAVAEAAQGGDFNQLVDTSSYDGALKSLGDQVNTISETLLGFINAIDGSIGALAQGDLSQRMPSDFVGRFGEVAENVNASIDKMTEIADALRHTGGAMSQEISTISNRAADLASRAESQASSLEQTAATMEEITSTIQSTAGNAGTATEVARHARTKADDARDVVSQAVTAMAAIEESSNKISDIISVIDGIAFQTNLLALNAAVEAARAGDSGKGFAVVASEVRNLAQRASDAANGVKELISESSSKVEHGVKLVNASGGSFSEIMEAFGKVSEMVEQISTASAEQSRGMSEISRAVAHLDEMTQQNSGVAEESASSARMLAEHERALSRLIAFFQNAAAEEMARRAA